MLNRVSLAPKAKAGKCICVVNSCTQLRVRVSRHVLWLFCHLTPPCCARVSIGFLGRGEMHSILDVAATLGIPSRACLDGCN